MKKRERERSTFSSSLFSSVLSLAMVPCWKSREGRKRGIQMKVE